MPTITKYHERLIRRLESTAPLDPEDKAVLADIPMAMSVVEEDNDVMHTGDRARACLVVIDGLVAAYKLVKQGRRQILALHFPGDMPGLQHFDLPIIDYSLCALTQTTVAHIAFDSLDRAQVTRPAIGSALRRHAIIQGAISNEWIVNVGRRNALERVAHLICECFVRSAAVGLSEGQRFRFAVTQAELGDATGLSNVHVNRTMKALRQRGLVHTMKDGFVINDLQALQNAGDFDPSYLHLLPETLDRTLKIDHPRQSCADERDLVIQPTYG